MKTAEEIIQEIKELPLEERQKVADYMSVEEEPFLETNYSPEDMAKLYQDIEEYNQGIDVVGPFTGEDAIAYLKQYRTHDPDIL